MKIKLWMLALLIFVVIFGGIGLTMLTGDWATESDKTPAKFTTGESAGEYNPEDIRGSYTFQDVADAFEIELSVLYDAFGIPAGTDGTAVKTKDIEAVYGDAEIGNGSVQVFVALYKNLPVTLSETYLPKRAAEIILETNLSLTQAQKDYLALYQIDTSAADTAAAPAETEAAETEAAAAEAEPAVKGTTTFQQAMDAGLTKEQIEAIIGGPMPAANTAIRDYCSQNGLSFSEIKTKLNDTLAGGE